MKKLSLFTILILGFILSSIAQTPTYVPSNGLMAWYSFNGNANDASGNGNNGTVYGASLTTDRVGKSNAAYSFNGSSNYISVANSSSLNIQNYSSGITISGWLKLNYIGYNAMALINFTQGDGTNINYVLDFSPAYSTEFMNWNISTVSAQIIYSNSMIVNTWYHIVVTSDFSTNTSKLYVNGILSGTCTTSVTKPVSPILQFGKHRNGSDPWWLNGILDDIGVWNRALTQAEVTGLYVGCPDSITVPPTNRYVYTGNNTSLNVLSSNPSSTFQWQTNPIENGWQNVATNSKYTGSTNDTLLINHIQLSNHLQPFRVIISNGSCIDTSKIVHINVIDTCINDTNHVTINDTVNVIHTDTNYYAVADTLVIDVELNIPNHINNTIKVYPNPAKDHITVDFGNYAIMNGCMLKIIDNLGQIVYLTPINQQTNYIDLSTWKGEGLYFIQILDSQNNTISTKKIVLK